MHNKNLKRKILLKALLKSTICGSLFSFCFLTEVTAQKGNIRFEILNDYNGLSNNTVNAIEQDSLGFLWFATDYGVNKYDGYNFTVFTSNPTDSFSIPHNKVRALYNDSKNRLWLGTSGGLSNYDHRKEQFINYLPGFYVRAFAESQPGILWLGTSKGLIKFNTASGNFIHYNLAPDYAEENGKNSIIALAVDHEENLWIATDGGGAFKFDPKSEKFKSYKSTPSKKIISSNVVLSVFEDSKKRLWLGTRDGLNLYNRSNDSFIIYNEKNIDIKSEVIFSITEDNNGTLWIGSYKGITRYNIEENHIIHYTNNLSNPYSISTNLVRCIFFSNDNILWIGTRDGGINKYDLHKGMFITYDRHYENNSNLTSNIISCIYEDENTDIWFGTKDEGVFKYNRKNGTYKHFSNNPLDSRSLSNDKILSLIIDSKGTVWVGTYGGGLNKYNKETGNFERYLYNPDDPTSITSNVIQYLFEDSEGVLWVGTDGGGLNRFNRDSETFTKIDLNASDSAEYQVKTILNIYEDSKKNLWIGTNDGGLFKLERETGTFTSYLYDPSKPDKKNVQQIIVIEEDLNNNLWLGGGEGLYKFNIAANELTQYSANNSGLPHNLVFGILTDNDNNLWISTEKGLSRFDQSNETFINYYKEDGLQGNEFGINAFHKGKSGRFYFGGTNGMNEFFPSDITENKTIPPVLITDFYLFDNRISVRDSNYLRSSIHFTEQITLDYTDYIFSFGFTALNYHQPSQNKFMYKLEGFDREWVKASSNYRRAAYTNIPSGEYIFKVKAANNDGYWNDKPADVKLIILPPYWQTWWFYLSVALFLVGLLYTIYRFRINKILEMEKLRIKIASDLHDEVGSTLTKVSMRAEMLETETKDSKSAANLKRISEQSREVVSTMRDIVWSIDSRYDKFGDLVTKIKDTAHLLLSEHGVQVELKISGMNKDEELPLNFRQNVFLILKESLNNVAKHSNADKVTIRITNSKEEFVMKIQDNGSDFEQKKNYSGQGLKNMQMRAGKIDGEIEFNYEGGFQVILKTAPVK